MRFVAVCALLLSASCVFAAPTWTVPSRDVGVDTNYFRSIAHPTNSTAPTGSLQAALQWLDQNWFNVSTNDFATYAWASNALVSTATLAEVEVGFTNTMSQTYLAKTDFRDWLDSGVAMLSFHEFTNTTETQWFTVPGGATQMEFRVWGAGGHYGGAGAYVKHRVPASLCPTGTVLGITVGAAGASLYAGGGRSAIWTNSVSNELVVAAGGGGGGAILSVGGHQTNTAVRSYVALTTETYGEIGTLLPGYSPNSGTNLGGAAGQLLLNVPYHASAYTNGAQGSRIEGAPAYSATYSAADLGLTGMTGSMTVMGGGGGGGYYGGGSGGAGAYGSTNGGVVTLVDTYVGPGGGGLSWPATGVVVSAAGDGHYPDLGAIRDLYYQAGVAVGGWDQPSGAGGDGKVAIWVWY
jgi:hypothetical protein